MSDKWVRLASQHPSDNAPEMQQSTDLDRPQSGLNVMKSPEPATARPMTILRRPGTIAPSASYEVSQITASERSSRASSGDRKWLHDRAPDVVDKPSESSRSGSVSRTAADGTREPAAANPTGNPFRSTPTFKSLPAQTPKARSSTQAVMVRKRGPTTYSKRYPGQAAVGASKARALADVHKSAKIDTQAPVGPSVPGQSDSTVHQATATSSYADALISNQVNALLHQCRDPSEDVADTEQSDSPSKSSSSRGATKIQDRTGQDLHGVQTRAYTSAVSDNPSSLQKRQTTAVKLARKFDVPLSTVPQGIVKQEAGDKRPDWLGRQTRQRQQEAGLKRMEKNLKLRNPHVPVPGVGIPPMAPRAMIEKIKHLEARFKERKTPESSQHSAESGVGPVYIPSKSVWTLGDIAERVNWFESAAVRRRSEISAHWFHNHMTSSAGKNHHAQKRSPYANAFLSNTPDLGAEPLTNISQPQQDMAGTLDNTRPGSSLSAQAQTQHSDMSTYEHREEQEQGLEGEVAFSSGSDDTVVPRKNRRTRRGGKRHAGAVQTAEALARRKSQLGEIWPAGIDGSNLPTLRPLSESAVDLTKNTLLQPESENELDAWEEVQKSKSYLASLYSPRRLQADGSTITIPPAYHRAMLSWAKAQLLNTRWYYVNLVAFRDRDSMQRVEELKAHYDAVQASLDADQAHHNIASAPALSPKHSVLVAKHALMEAIYEQTNKVWRKLVDQRERAENGLALWTEEELALWEFEMAQADRKIEGLRPFETDPEAASMQAMRQDQAVKRVVEKNAALVEVRKRMRESRQEVADNKGEGNDSDMGRAWAHGRAKRAASGLSMLNVQLAQQLSLSSAGDGNEHGSLASPMGGSDGGVQLAAAALSSSAAHEKENSVVAAVAPGLSAHGKKEKMGGAGGPENSHSQSSKLALAAARDETSGDEEVILFRGRGKKSCESRV